MTWMQRVRPLALAGGGMLVVGSLLGARLFSPGGGGGTDATARSPAPPAAAKDGPGTIVVGYADSEPSPVGYGLPPSLASGQIDRVFVRPGDEVKVRAYRLFGGTVRIGDPLYKFDSRLQEEDLKQAECAVAVARAKLAEARGAIGTHATEMALADLAVKNAEENVSYAERAYDLIYRNVRAGMVRGATEPKKSPGEIDQETRNDREVFQLEVTQAAARREREIRRAQFEGLKTAVRDKLDPLVGQAQAEVRRLETLIDKARQVVDLCTVRAKTDGTVERVYARQGEVMGIGTREPAVILVPAGPRVVRAEVEAEFAHRIGQDKIRREVTITDHTDQKLAYKGVVKYIPTVFLPRRSSEAGFVPNETRVLEVVVEVTDPNPAGKPPLRVGQKVRVNFGP